MAEEQAQDKGSRFEVLATPLASIFGSGFLVIVPVLAQAVGQYMVYAMIAVTLLAYLVGSVIRHNIRVAEPVLAEGSDTFASMLEKLSDAAIVIAYIISITLYLHILASFLLGGLDMDTTLNNNIITSSVIIFIIVVGSIWGLGVLGFLEKWALFITLGLIALVLAGFGFYDFQALNSPAGLVTLDVTISDPWKALTVVAGTLIVVQGFETPRYLGDQFNAGLRVWGSRWSQIISTVIYVSFVFLALPVVHELGGQYDDNSLIKLVGYTAFVFLPLAVIVAAVLSQFSAAVADTFAAIGNMGELSNHRLKSIYAYLLIGAAALILTWSADTFQILALASRAFAFYYFLQCLVAFKVSRKLGVKLGSGMLAVVLGFIVLFAVPVG